MDKPDLLDGADTAAPPALHILGLYAEDVKRIDVVEITPTGEIVEITGKNGAGKSSILDCISWALEDAKHIQVEPIRRGAKEALIRLDLGEVIVTRTFKAGDVGFTTSLSVRTPDGAEYRRPRALIDSFIGALSLDPIALLRMSPKEQFTLLRAFVPAIDFDALDEANAKDFALRRELNAEAKRQVAAVERLKLPRGAELPEAPIDEAALATELEGAGKFNGEIEARRARRERTQAEADGKQQSAEALRLQADGLRRQAEVLIRQAEQTEADRVTLLDEAAELNEKLAAAPPLPEPIDTGALVARLGEARGINALFERARERDEAQAAADAAEAEATNLTERMDARNAAAREQIAAATLPVPGLTLTPDGTVRLGDVPFDQASDAEKLRAAIAIAMAMNPRLRVIRVRDGSLLDADGMRILAEMARAANCQVWIERVGSDSATGFEMVAGRLRKREVAAAS